jgi:hypothetical protein
MRVSPCDLFRHLLALPHKNIWDLVAMPKLPREFLYAKYFLRDWLRKTGIWYWLLPRERRLEDLSSNLVWGWWRFRQVLITLVMLGPGYYIPARHRPNFVYLDGLQDTFSKLRSLSRQREGRETGCAVLVDRRWECLVISGKTSVGTQTRTPIILTPQPGRENVQVPILTIHVHPDLELASGLSDIDYVSFLVDPLQIAMIMLWKGGVLFTLKTSATATNIEQVSAKRRIDNLVKKNLEQPWSALNWQNAMLSFNKEVCLEFGLTLYEAPAPSSTVARRIEVTR